MEPKVTPFPAVPLPSQADVPELWLWEMQGGVATVGASRAAPAANQLRLQVFGHFLERGGPAAGRAHGGPEARSLPMPLAGALLLQGSARVGRRRLCRCPGWLAVRERGTGTEFIQTIGVGGPGGRARAAAGGMR